MMLVRYEKSNDVHRSGTDGERK